MATTTAFSAAWNKVMGQAAHEIIVSEYCSIHTEPFQPVSDETRAAAERFYEKLVAEDKVMAYLEATAPKPCECCGRV